LAKDGLWWVLKPLMWCTGLFVSLAPLSSIRTKCEQEAVWTTPSMLVTACYTFFGTSPCSAGLPFLIGQADSLLLACLGQGFGGALVLQLLLAAIHLRLQAGEHPRKSRLTHGLSLKGLLGGTSGPSVLERLLQVPNMTAGARPAAVEALLDHQHFWRVHEPSKDSSTIEVGCAAAYSIIVASIVTLLRVMLLV
jgi:hypothetical protein